MSVGRRMGEGDRESKGGGRGGWEAAGQSLWGLTGKWAAMGPSRVAWAGPRCAGVVWAGTECVCGGGLQGAWEKGGRESPFM